MEIEIAPEDHPLRREVRTWLRENPSHTHEELAEAGWVAPHWPLPWGRGTDQLGTLIVHDELARASVPLPDNQIGIGWAGPALLEAGSEEQRQRYLHSILAGREVWCQLFSEPDAGSDLASVRTRAVRDGNDYVITGQKVWSTWAEKAQFGILLARTGPTAPKHAGISYFVLPMDARGVTVRPIREMTGETHFNEVFFDEVRIPATNLVGRENEGWMLAKSTLTNERLNLGRGGACWGMGPSSQDFLELVREAGGVGDPLLRQRVAQIYIEQEILAVLDQRMLADLRMGRVIGPEASIRKTVSDEHGQRLMELAKDLAGPDGMLEDSGPLGTEAARWHWGFLFSRALTIGGGTSQIQRTVLAKEVLGL